jgi:cytochrome c oxidase cbb3-type subunit 3
VILPPFLLPSGVAGIMDAEVPALMFRQTILIAGVLAAQLCAQLPSTPGTRATIQGSPAAIAGSKENPEAVARGGILFVEKCGGCHGNTAKGTNKAPDLVRSLVILDDEKGLLISPVIRNGRPDKGMPKLNLTEPQIADVVAWLKVQAYSADHRTTYVFLDALTGDAKKGEAYFNGAGGCAKCHSATGDMKGIGGKFDAHNLQSRWLAGRPPRGAKTQVTATITLADGKKVEGVVERYDDFTISVRDTAGDYHSYSRNNGLPKVEIKDPNRVHIDMMRKYTDADIHNVTAYLASLK